MNYQNLVNENNTNNDSADLECKQKSQTRTNLNQLKLLLWKNVTLQRRAVISTIIEICVPTLFAISKIKIFSTFVIFLHNRKKSKPCIWLLFRH